MHQATTANQNERKVMTNKFDELAKGLAQSVTRRGALKKFSVGLAGIALTSLGLAKEGNAQRGTITGSPEGRKTHYNCQCKKPDLGCSKYDNQQDCFTQCNQRCAGF
jgi:hypothetical protein